MKKFKSILFIVLCLNISFASAQDNKKLALVIGNAAYTQSEALKNPVRDAKAMRDKLKSIGFEVLYEEDASTEEMDKALRNFYEKLQGCDIGLFYFSGHGIESGGVNYLLPISSKIKEESDLKRNAVDLSEILSDASYSGSGQLVFIIDACRNNPLKKVRGESRGIQVVNNSSVTRSIVVCACGSGKTADDGNSEHSPFTQALLTHITESGKSFNDVIRAVKKDVNEATHGEQLPEIALDNTLDDIYLNGGNPAPDKKKEYYTDDKTLNVNVIYLCIGLFVVFFIIMLCCFIIFTDKGRQLFVITKGRISYGAKKTVSIVKEKTISVQRAVDALVLENKKHSENKQEQKKQNEEEKQ